MLGNVGLGSEVSEVVLVQKMDSILVWNRPSFKPFDISFCINVKFMRIRYTKGQVRTNIDLSVTTLLCFNLEQFIEKVEF